MHKRSYSLTHYRYIAQKTEVGCQKTEAYSVNGQLPTFPPLIFIYSNCLLNSAKKLYCFKRDFIKFNFNCLGYLLSRKLIINFIAF